MTTHHVGLRSAGGMKGSFFHLAWMKEPFIHVAAQWS